MRLPQEYQGLKVRREDSARWWFVCRFHKDHNPSMSVNKSGPYAGNFCCWGCGAKGTAATFAKKLGQEPVAPFPKMDFRKTLPEIQSLDPSRLARLFVQFRQYQDKRVFQKLADKLGIHPAVLDHFHIGFDGKAFTFPMFGPGGEMMGIRFRTLNGMKYALKGGRNGLFVPDCVFNPRYPLIVTEGESDAMAAFQMGFQVVGIPGKGQGFKVLAEWILEKGFTSVILVADNDTAGQAGAKALALYLALEHGIDVRIINPPKQYKDLRAWFNAGAKRSEVLDRIDLAQYHIGTDIVNGIRRAKIDHGDFENHDNV